MSKKQICECHKPGFSCTGCELGAGCESKVHSFEICICAAVKTTKGVVWRGQRHGDCFQAILRNGFKISKGKNAQGFVTSRGRFVTREEGRRLQDAAGIKSVSADGKGYRGKTLFSEDLY